MKWESIGGIFGVHGMIPKQDMIKHMEVSVSLYIAHH